MTCNPKWPEIQNNLLPGQEALDRPDVVARVFKLKKDQLIKDLTQGAIFGDCQAYLWVIEFQKRGLPHIHILIILAQGQRPKTTQQVDNIVSAELPPNPNEHGITDEEKSRRKPLWDIVTSNMIHGPCGKDNPNSPCMKNAIDSKCPKKFPKPFFKGTIIDDDMSHPIYRRRSPEDGGQTGIINFQTIDNRWVVPYNPYLSLRYTCHVNVEICASAMASKYLYKYVTKGPDRAMVSTEVDDQPRDEIRDYEDMRSVGSSEASWKIFSFPMAENKPPVQVIKPFIILYLFIQYFGGSSTTY